MLLQGSKLSKNNFVAKVGDFGLCRAPVNRGGNMTTFSWGTVDHMPPEVLRNGKLRAQTDVFSFAILLVEMMVGRSPFQGLPTPAVIIGIVEGMRPEIPKGCPYLLVELIKRCWDGDWRKRPAFGEVVADLMQLIFDLSCLPQKHRVTGETKKQKLPQERKKQDELLGTTSSSLKIEAWGIGKKHERESSNACGCPFVEK